MTKIPEDIKEGIIKIANERGIEPSVLVKRMEELIKTSPIIQTLTIPEEKIQVAWGLLASKYVRAEGGSGKKYSVLVLSVNGPRSTKSSRVTEIIGIAQGDTGVPLYAKLSAWQEVADVVSKLSRLKEYVLEIRGGITADGLNGTISDSAVEISRQPKIDAAKFFDDTFETDRRCTIADAELHVVDSKKERMNYRIMKATVLSSRQGETDGRKYCTYNIIDQTFTSSDRAIGFSVACNHDQYVCGSGSRAYFLGLISKKIKDNVTRLRMVNGIIWPITLIPPEAATAPTEGKEEVSVDEEEEGEVQ